MKRIVWIIVAAVSFGGCISEQGYHAEPDTPACVSWEVVADAEAGRVVFVDACEAQRCIVASAEWCVDVDVWEGRQAVASWDGDECIEVHCGDEAPRSCTEVAWNR